MEINIVLRTWHVVLVLKVSTDLTLGDLLKLIFSSKKRLLPYHFRIPKDGSKLKKSISTHVKKPLKQLLGKDFCIEFIFPYEKIRPTLLKKNVLQHLAGKKTNLAPDLKQKDEKLAVVSIRTLPSGVGILHSKAGFGILEKRDIILYNDQINFQLIEGLNAPLHIAAFSGTSIDLLLAAGADINLRNDEMMTPFDIVKKTNNEEIMTQLLDAKVNLICRDRGGDPNVQTDLGNTALHNAARLNDGDLASALLRWGANPGIKNDENQFPLELMTSEKEAKILIRHGEFLQSVPSGTDRDRLVGFYQQYFINPIFAEFLFEPVCVRPIPFTSIVNIISSFVSFEEKDWKKLLSNFQTVKDAIRVRRTESTLKNLKQNALEKERGILPVQGPAPLKDATLDFEYIVRAFINDVPISLCEDKANGGDILAIIKQDKYYFFNVNGILAREPDVEHIRLSDADLKKCYTHLTEIYEKFYEKFDINGGIARVESDFKENECKYDVDSQILHPAEKLAIFLYTGQSLHKDINNFFRNPHKHRQLLLKNSKAIFLIATVVTHALAKLPDTDEFPEAIRFEENSPTRIEILKKNSVVYEKSLLSSYGVREFCFAHRMFPESFCYLLFY